MTGSDVPHVDVQELMREVQRRARSAGDPDRDARQPRSSQGSLHEHYDLLATPLTSPRRGVGGVLRMLRRLLVRLLMPVLHRQTVFNAAVVGDMDEAALRTTELKRRLERQLAAHESFAERLDELTTRLLRLGGSVGRTIATVGPAAASGSPVVEAPSSRDLGFVDRFAMHQHFRGSEQEIRARQRRYLEHFAAGARIVDLGCGRGEFLELLRERGARGQGVDNDLDNVLHCRAKGLDVVQADAFAFLEGLADGSLDGLFCAQFIEHFPPPRVVHLVNLAAGKLAPDGVVIFETLNPACVSVFGQAFYLDFTHVWPYHPEAMKFVMHAAGFAGVTLVFSSPVDPEARLPEVRDPTLFGGEAEAYNRAAALVNRLLLGPQDYAVVGRKRAGPP